MSRFPNISNFSKSSFTLFNLKQLLNGCKFTALMSSRLLMARAEKFPPSCGIGPNKAEEEETGHNEGSTWSTKPEDDDNNAEEKDGGSDADDENWKSIDKR